MLWPEASPLDLDFGLCARAKLFNISVYYIGTNQLLTSLCKTDIVKMATASLSQNSFSYSNPFFKVIKIKSKLILVLTQPTNHSNFLLYLCNIMQNFSFQNLLFYLSTKKTNFCLIFFGHCKNDNSFSKAKPFKLFQPTILFQSKINNK